ncbi:MAG: acetoacetate decarboxylase family protein [Hydrococcus sp. C42_A2020_068]|nr:acetoacetate decarboxylase family protein [Hydrococcus sp. C42_A2020_068]
MTVKYPPVPWYLQGRAIQILNLVNIENSRPFVPPELEIVSLFPGKTLGGTYISTYESGSILEYNELIVVAALVRYQGKIGAWISHIYVDNEDSVAGGREIWGLPKEMAEFTWEKDSVSVRQQERQLCRVRYKKEWFSFATWWQQPFSGNVFGGLESELLLFKSELKSQLGIVSGNLEIPQESPFARLNLGQPWLILNCQNLELVAGIPKVVGTKFFQENPRGVSF